MVTASSSQLQMARSPLAWALSAGLNHAFASAMARRGRDAALLLLGLGRQGADHAAPGERRDAVGAHVEALHVERDRLRQADDAELGGGVVRLAEVAHEARGRGEVHEGAGLLLAK